jgi:NAD(P)-dependent dehydrogenase (short-subunit alcohol dehydrogenase family)
MHPGVIQTEMGEQSLLARAHRSGSNDTGPSEIAMVEATPLGRLGLPEDIAKGIIFLASDDAAYMNGASLIVDGGLTAA